jgi:hypothetical protein
VVVTWETWEVVEIWEAWGVVEIWDKNIGVVLEIDLSK